MTSVKTNKKGFTLVELVVVIAILAILAAIAIPVVNSIINTASKNGALSNASTIELAIKEAQADIASKNTETYGAKAVTSGGSTLTVKDVADAKAIASAFETITYNGTQYSPVWVNAEQKVYFVDASTNRLDDTSKKATGTALTATSTTTIITLSKKSTTT